MTPDRVFSWDAIEGEAAMHPLGKRQDPVAAAESIRQLIDLGYLGALPESAGAQIELVRRETEFNLGVVLMTTRRASEALVIFERLHAQSPAEPRFAMNFAHCLYQVGRHAEACRILEGLVAAHPEAVDAKMILAGAQFAAGRVDEARATLEQAERELPERRDRSLLLAEVYLHQRQWVQAKRVAARLLEQDPDDPRALLALGTAEMYLNNLERAAELCLSAIERRHFYPEAHYTLGVALTWMKDFQHAILSFKAAVSMQPGHLPAYRYLASIYRHLGDRKSARANREQAERLIAANSAGAGLSPELLSEPPMSPGEASGQPA